MAYLWVLITGIVITVTGIVVDKLFVKPVHDLNEALRELNSTLIFRYNIFGSRGNTKETLSTKTSEELRTHASLLLARAKRIYGYKCFTFFKLIPPRNNIYEAHKLLISISNSITPADKKENRADCEKIAQLLNLEVRVKINSACLPNQSFH